VTRACIIEGRCGWQLISKLSRHRHDVMSRGGGIVARDKLIGDCGSATSDNSPELAASTRRVAPRAQHQRTAVSIIQAWHLWNSVDFARIRGGRRIQTI